MCSSDLKDRRVLLETAEAHHERIARPLRIDELPARDSFCVGFLGGAHGHFDKHMAAEFVDAIGGQVAKMPSLSKLPDVLLQALTWIAEGAN